MYLFYGHCNDFVRATGIIDISDFGIVQLQIASLSQATRKGTQYILGYILTIFHFISRPKQNMFFGHVRSFWSNSTIMYMDLL